MTTLRSPRRGIPRRTGILLLLAGGLVHAAHATPRPRSTTAHHAPRGYAAAIKRWHTRAPDDVAPTGEDGRKLLVLEILNTGERVELQPGGEDGAFDATALAAAQHALRDQRSGYEFPVDPDVLSILYRLQTHFEAPAIRVVSAYRVERPGSRSRHARGCAVDLIVPGARDRDVATWVRGLGHTGVGMYTRSGFVHVDVRSTSYFWVDTSGPGQRNRARPVLRAEAARADRAAEARGCTRPHASVEPRSDVDATWRGRDGESSSAAPEDGADEHDDGPGG